MSIPAFRRQSAPQRTGKKERRREKFRGSRQSRGYDREWELLAADYRKSVKGRCEECARRGYLEFCDVIDHMEPVVDNPERRLDWSNLDALCHAHHNGLKRRIEDFARKTGQSSQISIWMKHPETRPAAFQIVKFGPLKGLLDEDQGEDRDSAG